MNSDLRISEITRRDIFDLLTIGIPDKTNSETEQITELFYTNNSRSVIKILYHGRLDEIEFLSRLYDLENMESYDSRYPNAKGDIYQHRVRNYDWDDNWVFLDSRFGLKNGNDEILLKFICEIFHPAVRDESKPWKAIKDAVNVLLQQDGYELYDKELISGRIVYGYRLIDAISIELSSNESLRRSELKFIGDGSYANVYKFYDDFYECSFVLKRAKKDLTEKELERFYREYSEMNRLDSPYIVKVYQYNKKQPSYVMEYLDETLKNYIDTNNGKLTFYERKGICSQFLKGFKYIHSKSLLHRDISHKNILIKHHDDGTKIVKISDFGLVKIPDSELTSENTKYKGIFNDPGLITEGFNSYNMLHETFAIVRLIFYTLTGRTNTSDIKNESLKLFVEKGLSTDKRLRYQNLDELISGFKLIEE